MRALLRPFALHAAYTPIETIVFFCIVSTLAYFHILDAVKHSAFLAPPAYSLAPPLKSAHALYKYGEWVSVTPLTWNNAKADVRVTPIELQQIVVSLDAAGGRNSITFSDSTLPRRP
ncbi:hypothetical protein BDQ17DRAFT_762992 [Cyathus striatus]|nr:hypothetical protein BDQ17DRAFT_762992 [Cyathus striatus]